MNHLADHFDFSTFFPLVWCRKEKLDVRKDKIVFELWQCDCIDCHKAREKARGSYSFNAAGEPETFAEIMGKKLEEIQQEKKQERAALPYDAMGDHK